MNGEANAAPGGGLPGGTLLLLWTVILVELISPIPAFLTFGAAWVLLARPPWFLTLVRELYAQPPEEPDRGSPPGA